MASTRRSTPSATMASMSKPLSGWDEQQYRLWQHLRRRGLLWHILVRWILRWGVPIFALNYANRRWGGHMVMDLAWWIWNGSVVLAVCILFGSLQWLWNQKQFRLTTARMQSVSNRTEERANATEAQH